MGRTNSTDHRRASWAQNVRCTENILVAVETTKGISSLCIYTSLAAIFRPSSRQSCNVNARFQRSAEQNEEDVWRKALYVSRYTPTHPNRKKIISRGSKSMKCFSMYLKDGSLFCNIQYFSPLTCTTFDFGVTVVQWDRVTDLGSGQQTWVLLGHGNSPGNDQTAP